MSCRTPALLATLALAMSAAAQGRRTVQPVPSDPALLGAARQRLVGASLADLAWGGHLVARHRLHELAPELRFALRQIDGDDRPAAELAAMNLLDAAHAIDAAIPAAELAPFAAGTAREVAILRLSRTPDAGRALLGVLATSGERRDLGWLAAGNLLARRPCAGFAARVADELELVLRVVVVDDHRALRAGGGYAGVACGGDSVPQAFPPIATWILHRETAAGRQLVARGLRSVWASRRVVRNDPDWPCRDAGVSRSQSMEARAGWLRQLAGLDATPDAHVHVVEEHWTTAAALADAVCRHRSGLAIAWTKVVETAVKRADGDVPRSPPPAPRIAVQLVDCRGDRSTPLPPPRR